MSANRHKKIWIAVFAAAVVFALSAAALAAAGRRPAELKIYAYDDCGGCFAGDTPCKPCELLEDLQLTYYEILERAGMEETAKITVYNTRGQENRDAMEAECARLSVPRDSVDMPLVVLNGGEWFAGETAAGGLTERLGRNALLRAFPFLRVFVPGPQKTATFDEKAMVYFYSDFCGDCARAGERMDEAVPAIDAAGISLTRICIDDDSGYTLLTEYLSDYGIAHKPATVPYVFMGDAYFYGSDEIGAMLDEIRGLL